MTSGRMTRPPGLTMVIDQTAVSTKPSGPRHAPKGINIDWEKIKKAYASYYRESTNRLDWINEMEEKSNGDQQHDSVRSTKPQPVN